MIRAASNNVVDPEELLRHAAWARRLARSLVGADADADDLVQDSLFSVWRRPPSEPAAPLRPWLRVLLRNRSLNRAREDRRREAREASAPQGPAGASPEELVGRVQIHKLLADAVLALPEPYRQTVLLRYFEELPSSDIAARTDVPAATVRGRLKTAMGMLRTALAAREGGRFDWMGALGGLLEGASNATLSQAPRRTIWRTASRIGRSRIGDGVGTAGAGGGLAVAAKIAVVAALTTVTGVTVQVARRPSATPSSAERAVAGDTDRPTVPADDLAGAISRPHSSVGGLGRDMPRRPRQLPVPATHLTVPTRTLPQLSTSSTGGLWWAGFSGDSSGKPCRLSKGPGPVFDACQKGGLPQAKKMMKKIIKDARERDKGHRETCEGCHKDLDGYELIGDARRRLEELLKVIGQDKSRPPTP